MPSPDRPTGDTLWHQDAIVYELHVKAFFDSNNDGVGDFPGLTSKLDYLHDLGVNTLWLLPFYPSPMRDDGYDIADYRNVAPEYGTRADFRHFVREAHRRGLRVITELVINHTSDQHPWFQAARRAPAGSVKRDYYVWSDSDKRLAGTRIIFTDTETSNWAWDPVAKAYYWHRFFSHQPDLNFNNPHVVQAVMRTMSFWLDQGVDGLRLDAIPYLCEREGTSNENLPETHDVIRRLRAELDRRYANRIFLAEANQWPEDVREYFGDGDECHMAYHFPLMPRLYMALAQEDRYPIIEIMRQTPDIPPTCQWAIFLRNHDELTLEMVTSRERDYLYQAYATDPRARINLGIRRRLAPLLDNDRAKIELMTYLLLSLPGSPILYYGDEIGMGDNFYLGDRNGVRTPMQWSPDRNGGFSRTDPQRLYLPPIMDPIYGYEIVNVESQTRSPSSLLNWTRRMLAVRKNHRAFGRGTLRFLEPGNRKVLAFLREYENETLLGVANLSRTPQAVALSLPGLEGRVPVELTGRTPFPPTGDQPYSITLPGYGYYWFELATNVSAPSWYSEAVPPSELPVLVMLEGWRTLFMHKSGANEIRRAIGSRTREQLQREVLGPYLATQRWFAAKGQDIERIEILEDIEWSYGGQSWLLAILQVHCAHLEPQSYFLPLGIAWDDDGEERMRTLAPHTLARIRQKERVGTLYSAFGEDAFCRAILSAMRENREDKVAAGMLSFAATSAFGEVDAGTLPVRRPPLDQSNSGVFFDEQYYLKAYRRLHDGIHPEYEMGRYLTEKAPKVAIVPVAGIMQYRHGDGPLYALALLQNYVENQGDAWTYTMDYLRRAYESRSAAEQLPASQLHASYLALAATMGRRVADLHRALGASTDDPDFEPAPITASDVQRWRAEIAEDLEEMFDGLSAYHGEITSQTRALASEVLAARTVLRERVNAFELPHLRARKSRFHGDLHLGQLLVVQNDLVITDFEGEPGRPLHERRRKHSPLKDVAGMLRSFSYVAAAAGTQQQEAQGGDRRATEEFMQQWEEQTTTRFLAAYREAMQGSPSYPADQRDAEQMLWIFSLEKALYELRYEQTQRPAWLHIPLRALAGMARSEEATMV